MIAGYVVAVSTAIAGLDAKALIAGAITRNAVETGLICWAEHPPRPRLYLAHLRELVSVRPRRFPGLADLGDAPQTSPTWSWRRGCPRHRSATTGGPTCSGPNTRKS